MHFLPGIPYLEPGEVVDTVGGHGARGEAQGRAVESGSEGEGAGRDEEVDVREAGDHLFCFSLGGCGGMCVNGGVRGFV